jgi:hypothetical protein
VRTSNPTYLCVNFEILMEVPERLVDIRNLTLKTRKNESGCTG